jgi:hypothetical protein
MRVVVMDRMEQEARTVAIKACTECAAGLLEQDKFCRWCGALQPRSEDRETNYKVAAPAESGAITAVPVTSALEPNMRTDVYRKISGPLVNALVTGALPSTLPEHQSPLIQRITLALISIPIWLMIVLLSPLDAYAAVKNLARQV